MRHGNILEKMSTANLLLVGLAINGEVTFKDENAKKKFFEALDSINGANTELTRSAIAEMEFDKKMWQSRQEWMNSDQRENAPQNCGCTRC